MEYIQQLLDNSSLPALTALLLGLMTAISPCPLATNIAAIGYIGRQVESRRTAFVHSLLYTLGRVLGYTGLGVVLIWIIKSSSSIFGIQMFISHWGELLLGPVLLLVGLYMLFGHKIHLPGFGYRGNGERLVSHGGWGALVIGVLFALAFCPSSAVFYFGMLIPLSVTAKAGVLLPVLFAVATALPVLVVSWILAFSMSGIAGFYGRIEQLQRWLNLVVGILFILIGLYYTINNLLL